MTIQLRAQPIRAAVILYAGLALAACGTDAEPTPTEPAQSPSPVDTMAAPTETPPEPAPETVRPAEPQTTTLSAEAAIEDDFLVISGTTNLPDGAMLRSTVSGPGGFEETLHPVVSDGTFEDSRFLADLPSGTLTIVVSFDRMLTVYGTPQPDAVAPHSRVDVTLTIDH